MSWSASQMLPLLSPATALDEPMLRPDFMDLVTYAVDRKVGVKFSTNGTRLNAPRARELASLDYLDVQVSLDGATAATNDAVRGE